MTENEVQHKNIFDSIANCLVLALMTAGLVLVIVLVMLAASEFKDSQNRYKESETRLGIAEMELEQSKINHQLFLLEHGKSDQGRPKIYGKSSGS